MITAHLSNVVEHSVSLRTRDNLLHDLLDVKFKTYMYDFLTVQIILNQSITTTLLNCVISNTFYNYLIALKFYYVKEYLTKPIVKNSPPQRPHYSQQILLKRRSIAGPNPVSWKGQIFNNNLKLCQSSFTLSLELQQ